VSGVTEYFDAEHIEALQRWPGVRVQVFPLSLEEVFLEVCGPRYSEDAPIGIFEPESGLERRSVSK
jgi:hypothetical protein